MGFYQDSTGSDVTKTSENPLLKYIQQQNPEVLDLIAKSASPEVKEIISHKVQGLVGFLPSDKFNVQITTSRDNLATLLSSAMMTGYLLHQMEQRMQLDESVSDIPSIK
ncbi:MAG: DUF760 domain-containing protein [Microcoleaceae cyanobacterium]